MNTEKTKHIKDVAKSIAIKTLLHKREYRDPQLLTEKKLHYTIADEATMLCVTDAIGSGSLIYLNNSTRAQEILDNFLVNTNETGSWEWLAQSTIEWMALSFSGKEEYVEWMKHLVWIYQSINPVSSLRFERDYIAIDADTCERLPDAELLKFFENNSYLVFLYTLQLSINEIIGLLYVPMDKLEND